MSQRRKGIKMGIQFGLKVLMVSIVLVMVASSVVVDTKGTEDGGGKGIISLEVPSFVSIASARSGGGGGSNSGDATREGTQILEEEAGICFHTNVQQEINLTVAKEVYRRTEHETGDYTIGAVALPGYPETEDVHVYVHKDGWIAAYYPNYEPITKIIDWLDFLCPPPRDITSTKLEDAILKMCDGVNVTLIWTQTKYHDFRAPNADRMMIVTGAQRVGGERVGTFKIELPGDLLVGERSWSHFAANSSNSSSLSIDEHTINSFGPCRDGVVTKYGTLTQTQLNLDEIHTVRLGHGDGIWTTGEAVSAIALIYRTGASPIEIGEKCDSLWNVPTEYPKELINDTVPPVITNVTVTDITTDSATIKWDTDEIAYSVVKYGKTSGVYTKLVWSPLFITTHLMGLTELLPGTSYYFVVNSADQSGNWAGSSEFCFTTEGADAVFDTGAPVNPYHNIPGTHNGTITPNQTIEVVMLYTYSCPGTGGHSEYMKIWNETGWNAIANWHGYKEDWHNISFDTSSFTLVEGETYYYSIKTGAYPQIHHTDKLSTPCGVITCSEFMDANGKRYDNWIPAIKLFRVEA
ncbi:hypothetical protein C5S39_09525 [Candidatus Methanophagaceae archaeon]|nr:hypothetical protein C5S39_09525 [Methanophagales archaeon]